MSWESILALVGIFLIGCWLIDEYFDLTDK